VDDVGGLLGLVAAAEDAHERLIAVHLASAERRLTARTDLGRTTGQPDQLGWTVCLLAEIDAPALRFSLDPPCIVGW